MLLGLRQIRGSPGAVVVERVIEARHRQPRNRDGIFLLTAGAAHIHMDALIALGGDERAAWTPGGLVPRPVRNLCHHPVGRGRKGAGACLVECAAHGVRQVLHDLAGSRGAFAGSRDRQLPCTGAAVDACLTRGIREPVVVAAKWWTGQRADVDLRLIGGQ